MYAGYLCYRYSYIKDVDKEAKNCWKMITFKPQPKCSNGRKRIRQTAY